MVMDYVRCIRSAIAFAITTHKGNSAKIVSPSSLAIHKMIELAHRVRDIATATRTSSSTKKFSMVHLLPEIKAIQHFGTNLPKQLLKVFDQRRCALIATITLKEKDAIGADSAFSSSPMIFEMDVESNWTVFKLFHSEIYNFFF